MIAVGTESGAIARLMLELVSALLLPDNPVCETLAARELEEGRAPSSGVRPNVTFGCLYRVCCSDKCGQYKHSGKALGEAHAQNVRDWACRATRMGLKYPCQWSENAR